MKNKELNKVETKAIELINMYFHDKKDKGGNNYLEHLWNVAGAIEREASIEVVDRQSSKGIFYQKAFIVALLHDILEDTDITEEELYKIGCDDEIVKAVKSVTRKQEEKYYFDFIERASQNDIGRLVKKYDLYLFSDEVYREYIYTGSPYISACHLEGIQQNVVLIDSVSKRYSECGIRIGALITKNEEVRQAVMKLCQARLSPPLIGQIAAEASLEAPDEYYLNVYDEYVERRKCLIDGLNRIPGVYSQIPMGAFYTVAKLPVDDSEKFCRWCLEEFNYEGETVMMAPASGFYTTPGVGINQVRIAYVLKKEDLNRALFILRKALEAYPGRVNGEE